MAGESRQALLGRVVDHLVSAGTADLSLRQLAAAVGSSHRMLLYHFGSSENLMEAVVLEVEQRTRTWFFEVAQPEDASLAELVLLLWDRASSEELEPLVRLFFALYSRMVERRRTTELTEQLITSWLDPAVASLTGHGMPAQRAAELARLGLAVTRGLLLDVLATGDRVAARAAMRAYADAVFPAGPT